MIAVPPTSSPGSFILHYIRPHRRGLIGLGLVMLAMIVVRVLTPVLAARFIDAITAGRATSTLIALASVTIGVGLMTQVIRMAEIWLAQTIGWDATNALRADVTAHLLRLDASYYGDKPTGELIERVDGDVAALGRVFSNFIVIIGGNLLLAIAIIVILFATDWPIGVVMLAVTIFAFAVTLLIRRKGASDWAAERQATADYYGFIGEHLTGLDDLRTSGGIPWVIRRHALQMRAWLKAKRAAEMRGYSMAAAVYGAFWTALGIALALAAWRYLAGDLSLGGVFLTYQLISMLGVTTNILRNEIQELQQADAGLGRITGLMATQPAIKDGSGRDLPTGPLSVAFDDVTFGYQPANPVIRSVSLTVPAGTSLGIIGRTGSGKTTITRLISRLYDPDAGVVRVGGVNVRDVALANFRQRIATVSQDVRFFTASVRDNLTLFDASVPDHRLLEVLQQVGLGEWFAGLPSGLETLIRADGADLSAGQAQLLSCARVLLRDPDLLVLDEASARLDPATDRLVHAAFDRIMAGRTAVIIAHRLTTLAHVDAIVVMADGLVVEQGPRAALAADPQSRYSEMLREGGMA